MNPYNLLGAVRNLFSPELITNAALFLRESEYGIHKALVTAGPAILAAVLDKTGSIEGAIAVLGMAKEAAVAGGLKSPGSFMKDHNSGLMTMGTEIITALFGKKPNKVINLLANHAHIRESSAASLLIMSAPAVMGLLGKLAVDHRLSPAGLYKLLFSQKAAIVEALPQDLATVSSKLAVTAVSNNGISNGIKKTVKGNRGTQYLLPIIIVLATVLLAIWLWLFGHNETKQADSMTALKDSWHNQSRRDGIGNFIKRT